MPTRQKKYACAYAQLSGDGANGFVINCEPVNRGLKFVLLFRVLFERILECGPILAQPIIATGLSIVSFQQLILPFRELRVLGDLFKLWAIAPVALAQLPGEILQRSVVGGESRQRDYEEMATRRDFY